MAFLNKKGFNAKKLKIRNWKGFSKALRNWEGYFTAHLLLKI